MFRTPLLLALAALSSLTAAQLPANAPDCATLCFATKITEAGSLAPGVAGTDIAGLCAAPNFVQAYYNCLSDHCTAADLATGVTLGQQVCASAGGSVFSSGITGSATTVLSTLSPVPASTGSVTGSVASEFSSLVSETSRDGQLDHRRRANFDLDLDLGLVGPLDLFDRTLVHAVDGILGGIDRLHLASLYQCELGAYECDRRGGFGDPPCRRNRSKQRSEPARPVTPRRNTAASGYVPWGAGSLHPGGLFSLPILNTDGTLTLFETLNLAGRPTLLLSTGQIGQIQKALLQSGVSPHDIRVSWKSANAIVLTADDAKVKAVRFTSSYQLLLKLKERAKHDAAKRYATTKEKGVLRNGDEKGKKQELAVAEDLAQVQLPNSDPSLEASPAPVSNPTRRSSVLPTADFAFSSAVPSLSSTSGLTTRAAVRSAPLASPAPTTASSSPELELATVRLAYETARREGGATFLALDVEFWEFDQNFLLEFGWTILEYSKDAEGKVEERRTNQHVVIKENEHRRNHRFAPDARDHFDFGRTLTLPLPTLKSLLHALLASLSSTSPVFLIFHDPNMDLRALAKLGFDVRREFECDLTRVAQREAGQGGVWVVDTQRLFEGWMERRGQVGLEKACKELEVPTKRLHNAGNDAHYTLDLFERLMDRARRPALDSELVGQPEQSLPLSAPLGSPPSSPPPRTTTRRQLALLLLLLPCAFYLSFPRSTPSDLLSRLPVPCSLRGGPAHLLNVKAASCPAQVEPRRVGADWRPEEDVDYVSKAVERLQGAIRIRTESFDDMNLDPTKEPRFEIMGQLHEYLERTFPRVFETLEVEKVQKYGLLLTWKGEDEGLKPVVLMAHQDVVPVNKATESQWTHPPFEAHQDEDGWIWGRGSADCKNTLIGIFSALDRLILENFVPPRTIILSSGFDEEIGGSRSAAHLASTLQARYGENGIALVLDEGFTGVDTAFGGTTFARFGVAEKGAVNVKLDVLTPGGHSSVPLGAHTGIGLLARLVVALEDHPSSPTLQAGNPVLSYLNCAADYGKMDEGLKRRIRRESEWKKLGEEMAREDAVVRAFLGTTQAVDLVQGGIKINALPEYATASINYRIDFLSSVNATLSRIASVLSPVVSSLNLTFDAYGTHPDVENNVVRLSVVEGSEIEPAPLTPTEGDAWDLMAGTTRGIWEGAVVAPSGMVANTDTKYSWPLSRNIYRFVPGSLDLIKNFHTVDERIHIDAHLSGIRFFRQLLRNLEGWEAE
ncbi:hypothetical protein JCM1840_001956 [Sporobolomyces johnsonii]